MATSELELPIIDISGFINPKSPEDRQKVIEEVADASRKFGFFQIKGHGVPLESQKALLNGINNFFNTPREEKVKLSFLESPCRRGYESSGMTLRVGDKLPDSKEAFYIGREDPVVEPPGFHGPNRWPDMPEDQFKAPIWEYYEQTNELGKTLWEILILGLGYTPTLMEGFTKRPIVMMKMIKYPGKNKTMDGQFGVGPHTDFGGVTVLLQQPERNGLEVYLDEKDEWIPVPAIEDVYVINCGDMIQKWSGGQYKSARHRVINKGDEERLSCATFWHGDFNATNPLNPNDPNKDTVGGLLLKRFGSQFSLSKEVMVHAAA